MKLGSWQNNPEIVQTLHQNSTNPLQSNTHEINPRKRERRRKEDKERGKKKKKKKKKEKTTNKPKDDFLNSLFS
jgi:hypothetical protein